MFAPLEERAWMPPLVQTAAEETATAFLPKVSSSEIQALDGVAAQCPYTGGGAVFAARSLLDLVGMGDDYEHVGCAKKNLPPKAKSSGGLSAKVQRCCAPTRIPPESA